MTKSKLQKKCAGLSEQARKVEGVRDGFRMASYKSPQDEESAMDKASKSVSKHTEYSSWLSKTFLRRIARDTELGLSLVTDASALQQAALAKRLQQASACSRRPPKQLPEQLHRAVIS